LDLERRRVRFERERFSTPSKGSSADSEEELIGRARELSGIEDRAMLIEEALRALIAREAGRRLIELGGTMPDFKLPPRRRPPY
jgi:hypothetical protein